MSDWTGRPVTILGLSRSGSAVARYVQRLGGSCLLSEVMPATEGNEAARKELQELGVDVEMGGHSHRCFEFSDLVVLSPGIPPSSPFIQQLKLSEKELISEVELAWRESELHGKRVPWVAITGTNGKTTVTSLISHILESAGQAAPACGNIGTPVMSILDQAQQSQSNLDALVVELSSFQLHFSPKLRAKVAVWTNFTPDHLDWHGSLEAYYQAKASLFTGSQAPEWAVINGEDPELRNLASVCLSAICWFGVDPASVSHHPNHATLTAEGDIVVQWTDGDGQPQHYTVGARSASTLVGRHNTANLLASAAAALLMGVSSQQVEQAIASFRGVEHRLEWVAHYEGVDFYNDSKATNPEASISAVMAFDSTPIVTILGGKDKGTPLDDLTQALSQRAAAVVLLGEAQDRFAQAFEGLLSQPVRRVNGLDQAIETAYELAQGQYPVVFTPACSSFDAYTNFEMRGRAFKAAVDKHLSQVAVERAQSGATGTTPSMATPAGEGPPR